MHQKKLKDKEREISSQSRSPLLPSDRNNLQPADGADLSDAYRSERASVRQALEVDVGITNLTVILENVQIEGRDDPDAPWMYSETLTPFDESSNATERVHAFTRLRWNPNGVGNGSCASGGSGKISRGYLDPFNFHVKMKQEVDFDRTSVELRNLSLSDFVHINTVFEGADWQKMGQAGDERRYSYGSLRISNSNEVLLEAVNLQLLQNTSYPVPVGEAPPSGMYVGGYFLGEINEFGSNDEWVNQLDPFGMGYVIGIVSAASFGPPNCITSNSYWITLRGFPDLKRPTIVSPYVISIYNDTRRSGAKSGIYLGSNSSDVEIAETLANTSRSVVTSAVSVCVLGAAGSAAAAVVVPGAVAAPPGQGMFRLVSNTAFVSKMNEVYGFHSDAMSTFGEGLQPFIGKLEFPFSSETLAESRFGRWFMKTVDLFGRSEDELAVIARQEVDGEVTVSDELFGGCAFYTTIVVVVFLLVHLSIWLATRKKPLQLQLTAHSWMIYIFSIIMSYVFTASVLNSMQYLRSHLFRGTGKIGFYIIAFLQLLIVGVGFTTFFMAIMILAVKRVRNKRVKWVPRDEIPSPKIRNKIVIRGEYQVGDENVFHTLFECYYSSMAGPRLWLAGIELIIVFLDAIFTATIWNEVVCFAVLICVYAILFILFLIFAPFVDKIEGRLVTSLGLIDLVLLIVEFMASLGDYETAEQMERTAVVIGFVSIGFAVLIAVYCDLLPMAVKAFKFVRRKCTGGTKSETESEDSATRSEWSFISKSNASGGSIDHESEEKDKQVISEQDDSFRGLISQVFKSSEPRQSSEGALPSKKSPAFDWRRGSRKIDWGRGSDLVTPTSDGKLRILNSADSDEAIEWPMVGQVIYSVRDFDGAANTTSDDNEMAEDSQHDEDEGPFHVQEQPR